MAFSLLKLFQPKDKVFYGLFEQMTEHIVQASEKFVEGMKAESEKRFEIHAQTKPIEHQADQVTHQIYVELGKNFITPFDREDIHALASALDDIVDYIDEVGHKIKVFDYKEFNHHLYQISELNDESVKALREAIYELRNMKNLEKVNQACLKVHGYESKVDLLYNEALGALIREHKDNAAYMIIMKDLIEELELISDKCQDASNIIESIVIKYS
ncbi:MAG: DUF47 family protein [Chitinophagales bacterium]|nr:DUF47 family protein [Chitinophagales bacterium]